MQQVDGKRQKVEFQKAERKLKAESTKENKNKTKKAEDKRQIQNGQNAKDISLMAEHRKQKVDGSRLNKKTIRQKYARSTWRKMEAKNKRMKLGK